MITAVSPSVTVEPVIRYRRYADLDRHHMQSCLLVFSLNSAFVSTFIRKQKLTVNVLCFLFFFYREDVTLLIKFNFKNEFLILIFNQHATYAIKDASLQLFLISIQ